MKEDFVFHFRSVLELNLSFELETELAKWESNLTQCLTTWGTEHLNVLSRLSGNELEEYLDENPTKNICKMPFLLY